LKAKYGLTSSTCDNLFVLTFIARRWCYYTNNLFHCY